MIYHGVQQLVMIRMNANDANATVMQQGVISIVLYIRLLVNFHFVKPKVGNFLKFISCFHKSFFENPIFFTPTNGKMLGCLVFINNFTISNLDLLS